MQTERCRVFTGHSVRRVHVDRSGLARAVVVRGADARSDRESPADVVIVAGGAIESARLLLLSKDVGHPDGLGNQSGQVGRNFVIHHIWGGHLDYREALFPERSGPEMAQSRQFLDPPTRDRHGGVLVQLPSRTHHGFHPLDLAAAGDGEAVLRMLRPRLHCELVYFHAESIASERKCIRLSQRADRFGDPLAHVAYSSSEMDHATHQFSSKLLEAMATATRAREYGIDRADLFGSGHHHMGTCRMGTSPADSVVDANCRVHGTRNVWVVGGGVFPGGGAVHPTLTMVALAIRAADQIFAFHH